MSIRSLKSTSFGLAVGLAARLLLPGRHSAGIALTAFLSVLGALGAGLLADRLVPNETAQPARFLFSAVGAIAVLLCYAVITH